MDMIPLDRRCSTDVSREKRKREINKMKYHMRLREKNLRVRRLWGEHRTIDLGNLRAGERTGKTKVLFPRPQNHITFRDMRLFIVISSQILSLVVSFMLCTRDTGESYAASTSVPCTATTTRWYTLRLYNIYIPTENMKSDYRAIFVEQNIRIGATKVIPRWKLSKIRIKKLINLVQLRSPDRRKRSVQYFDVIKKFFISVLNARLKCQFRISNVRHR